MEKGTLVLEGGALRGIFTSGVLDCLMERELYMSHVIGVSAGSCNGVDYLSRQIGRTKQCMVGQNSEFRYSQGIRRFVKEQSLLNMDLIFDKYPKEIYPFDFDTYFSSEIQAEWVVTNCITGKAEYLDERQDKDRILKITRASSSMPLLSPIVNVDDVPYLDGGLADSIPIKRAMQLGNKKIVVVATKNKGYRKKILTRGEVRIYESAYRKYPKLVQTIRRRTYMYNHTIEKMEQLEDEGRIFVIRPNMKLISRLEHDVEKIDAFYQHGYEEMGRQYEALMGYLNA